MSDFAPHSRIAHSADTLSARGRRRSWREPRHLLLVLPIMLFLTAVFLLPVGRLLLLSVTDPDITLDHYRKLFESRVYLRVFTNTLRLAAIVTVGTLVLAYPTAYYMTRVSRRSANLMMLLILIPFWTSILVRSYAWMVILGSQGLINSALMWLGLIERPLPLLYNTFAVAISMIHILLPFMILPLLSSMRGIDRTLLQAGESLGGRPYQISRDIFLPLSLPGVVAGCSIVFILSLGFFITPALLGGRQDMSIAMLIAQQFNALLNWGFGAALSVVLLVVALAIMLLFNRIAGVEQIYGRNN